MILIVYILWFGWYLYSYFKGVFQEKDGWKKWKEQDGIALIVNATCFFVDCLGCGFGLICSQ